MKFRGESNKLGKTVAETHLSLQHIEETKGSTKRDRRLSEEASALDEWASPQPPVSGPFVDDTENPFLLP